MWFLRFVSHWPRPLRYGLAMLMAFLLRWVLRYRVGVVKDNLALAFPGSHDSWRRRLVTRFYRTWAEMGMEVIRTLSMKVPRLEQRVRIEKNDAWHQLDQSRQSAMVITAHLVNYEWVGQAVSLSLQRKMVGVYKPIKSKLFNQLMLSVRQRFGNTPVPMAKAFPAMLRGKAERELYFFVADQRPQLSNAHEWVSFMGIETPFFTGPFKLAARLGIGIYYIDIEQQTRGRYCGRLVTLTEDASQMDEGTLTQLYVEALEANIRRQPELWLWTHKRWKFRRGGETSSANG